MILFPNAKINIGLRILCKRPDGYHDIESVFVPLPWCDILEIVPAKGAEATFNIVGEDILKLDKPADNIVVKAVAALDSYLGFTLPQLDIYLSKKIPTGAGLGGGSADAAFAIRGINEMLGLGLGKDVLASIAAQVGADCPFFIYNRPMLVEGIGDIMTPVDIPLLDSLWIVAAKIPGTEVSTREAYAGVRPKERTETEDMVDAIGHDISVWTHRGLVNDFEVSVFAKMPEVEGLKKWFMSKGECRYCSMSGSGSTVYAIYDREDKARSIAAMLAATYPVADIFTGRLSSGAIN